MKINVKDGGKRKKWLHVLDHDVSTTSDFGFCQPLMAREINAQDTVNLSIPQFVRLGVVVKPTFGRIHLRTYNKFVPIESIYEPWGSLQAGQSYSHGGSSYIPTEVYNMRLMDIWKLCCLHSEMVMFEPTSMITSGNGISVAGITPNNVWEGQQMTDIIDCLWNSGELYSGCHTNLASICNTLGLDSNINESPTAAQCDLNYYDWFMPTFLKVDDDTFDIFLCGRFTRAGRNLASILKGCGYQMNLSSNQPKTILPLMAYYKTYFDLFNPNRDLTWKDTNLYMFTESAQTNNKYNGNNFFRNTSISYLHTAFLRWFLKDLPTCYYTFNPDYVSAHITGTSLNVATQVKDGAAVVTDGPAFPFVNGENNLAFVGAYANSNSNATLENQMSLADVNRSALRILDILTKRINIHTAIGSRVSAYLRSVFGSQYLENDVVDNLGSQSFSIDISDVMSTAETADGALGEYAGKGIGCIPEESRDGGPEAVKINFTAPTTGFLVSIIALVPESRYSQGVDPLLSHIHRREFFDPEFDGVTLLPNEQDHIYGISELGGFNSLAESFGNIPVYSEYKIANNVLNGDMSRLSTRNTFLPYTLDRLLPMTKVQRQMVSTSWKVSALDPETIVNGTFWRYCNFYRWFGNYNRIFLTTGQEFENLYFDDYNFFNDLGWPEDNFIIHNRILLKIHSFALPMSDSFDTGSFDGATMKVEKA